MMNICWLCDSPIDIDEAIEGHVEAHAECLLELITGGAWYTFMARCEQQVQQHERAIMTIRGALLVRKATILATA